MKYYFLKLFCLLSVLTSFIWSGFENADAQIAAPTSQLSALPVKIKLVENTSYNKQDYIHYRDADRLSWSDFKGPKRPLGNHLAYTAVEIVCDIKDVQHNPDTIIYTVAASCLFSKQQSYNTPGNRKIWLLEHEIMHVKIAAIKYLDFVQKLQERTFYEKDNVPQQISQLYYTTIEQCRKEQQKYDLLTKHGLNRKIQYQRNTHISKELEMCDNLNF